MRADTVFTEVLIARHLEFNSVFTYLTLDIENTEDLTREQQTLSVAVSRVSSANALPLVVTNVDMVYTQEELLRNSEFTSFFICASLRQISNDEQQ